MVVNEDVNARRLPMAKRAGGPLARGVGSVSPPVSVEIGEFQRMIAHHHLFVLV